MTKYIVKRVLLGILTFFIVITFTFFLMNLIPGGPFTAEKSVGAETQQMMAEKYGLDKPLTTQYVLFLKNLVKGDLGMSIKNKGVTVSTLIAEKLPNSAKLGGIAIVVSVLIGVPLGSISAVNRNKWLDKVISVFSTLGIAVPSFVVCSLLSYFVGLKLGWLPIYGLDSFAHYILPVISLAFYPTAYIARITRSSMLDVLGQDYIRTAKAKGVSNIKIIFKHTLRNAVLPVITYLGPLLAYTMTGSFVVEKIFNINGLGRVIIDAIVSRDYSVIMGTTIVLAAIMLILNTLVDIAYKFIDPRIKLD